MLTIKIFCFNPFQENTYLLYNSQNDAIVIDPGCCDASEREELHGFIRNNNLKVKLLLQTHAHIDHVLGTEYVARSFGLIPQMHEAELPVYRAVKTYAGNYGFQYQEPPEPSTFLKDAEIINFGEDSLEVVFCPGHSPGSVCFYVKEQEFLIGGDVLFYRSIGRTDLPGGDHGTLIRSIKEKLYSLPESTIVYPGHGPQTTIGSEKIYNPFVNL
jgi:hydroxyacylglutathione hydrolase